MSPLLTGKATIYLWGWIQLCFVSRENRGIALIHKWTCGIKFHVSIKSISCSQLEKILLKFFYEYIGK